MRQLQELPWPETRNVWKIIKKSTKLSCNLLERPQITIQITLHWSSLTFSIQVLFEHAVGLPVATCRWRKRLAVPKSAAVTVATASFQIFQSPVSYNFLTSLTATCAKKWSFWRKQYRLCLVGSGNSFCLLSCFLLGALKGCNAQRMSLSKNVERFEDVWRNLLHEAKSSKVKYGLIEETSCDVLVRRWTSDLTNTHLLQTQLLWG